MAKTSTRYVCQECGSWYPKWSGKCDACNSWNCLVEEKVSSSTTKKNLLNSLEFTNLKNDQQPHPRLLSENKEFDRVCGGGLVPGSVLLVGGDPGIGKSTLLLQIITALSERVPCAYISGEESIDQVRIRAERLGLKGASVHLASATHIPDILAALDKITDLQFIVIDSIQTMYSETIESAPGTVSQVRTCAHELITAAKKRNIIVVLVGHVTKEGVLAGPRVLEHMVDTVLYFEGERNGSFRILRSVKNRYGATDEIGVFEMRDSGLKEVANPSALFLNNHQQEVSGSAIFAGIEGTRPILLEIQALVAPSYLAAPRRTAVGWDSGRLSMVLAVLETRCGVVFGNKDVYLNVAGGLKISEPAADLAVAAALISSLRNIPIPAYSIFFGEVGLGGEIRSVSQREARLKEASKLGFKQAYFAANNKYQPPLPDKNGLQSYEFLYLFDLLQLLEKSPHTAAKKVIA